MNDGITLITPTGGRPEAFAKCLSYVKRFEIPEGLPWQWIIVDDINYSSTLAILDAVENFRCDETFLVPDHKWKPGLNTLGLNICAALNKVKYQNIFIIEDDDWYAASYINDTLKYLHDFDVVGESPARYYNVARRDYATMQKRNHASLCQTAFRASKLEELRKVIESSAEFIDVNFWRNVSGKKIIINSQNCVGIKGLPGRPGIGIGHRPGMNGFAASDIDLKVFKSWVGEDFSMYFKEGELT